jgi:hypothetical protein
MTDFDGAPPTVNELDPSDLVFRARQIAKKAGEQATGLTAIGSDSPEMVALLDALPQVDGANGTLKIHQNINPANVGRIENLRAAAAAKAQPPQAE